MNKIKFYSEIWAPINQFLNAGDQFSLTRDMLIVHRSDEIKKIVKILSLLRYEFLVHSQAFLHGIHGYIHLWAENWQSSVLVCLSTNRSAAKLIPGESISDESTPVLLGLLFFKIFNLDLSIKVSYPNHKIFG